MGQGSQKSSSNSLKSLSSQENTLVSKKKKYFSKEDIERMNRNKIRQEQNQENLTLNKKTLLSATKQPIDIVQSKYECPNNLIGYLYWQLDQRSQYLGSCFFIMESLVVTSAHQIPNKKEGDLIVYIPKDNKGEESKKYFTFAVKNTILNDNYKQYRQEKYDYAFLLIKEPLNEEQSKNRQQMAKRTKKLKFFDYKKVQKTKFSFLEGINYGFIAVIPSEIQQKQKIDKFRLLCSKGSIYYYNGEFLEYDAYTINGMSGGPIFIQNQERKKVLIGMHSYGNCYQEKNYGLLFGLQFYQQLEKQAQSYKDLKMKADLDKLIQGLGENEQFYGDQKMKQFAQSYDHMSFKGIFQKVQVDMYISLQDKMQEITKQSMKQQIKDVEQILDKILKLLKKLQRAQIYVSSLQGSDIVLYREEWRIKSAQLCYNPLYKIKKIEQQNSVIFLKKYLNQNTFIKQIRASMEYQQSDSKLKTILNKLQQICCIQDYFNNQNNFIEKNQNKKQLYRLLPSYKLRFESLTYLIKYCSKKLTSKSVLRIYMTMIMEIIQQLKMIKQTKLNYNFSFYFKGFTTGYQKEYLQYKTIYQNLFKVQEILNKQDLIEDLVKYQIIFIKGIYQPYFSTVYRSQDAYSNYDYKLSYKLYNQSDSLPQNAVVDKQIKNKNINLLKHFFKQYETKQHMYKITKMTEDQQKKYKDLTEKIVGIINTQNGQKLQGTGFIIDEDLIITALHVLGDIEDSKHLSQRLKTYFIKYKGQLLEIESFYPRVIKSKVQRQNAQNTKYDIIVLKLKNKIQDFKGKLAFMQFQNQEKSNKAPQRHAALLIGVGEEQHNNKKTMVFKKSIGQMSIFSSNNYFLPLQGQKGISGSPIFMFTKQRHPFIVGIYTTIITNRQQSKRYGVYEKFDKQYFQQIQSRFDFQLSANYQFNQEFYNEYIKQTYVTYDHFLLRLIAQILKLNHYHFYIKRLKMSNLILNIENSLSILFNDLQLINIDMALNQQKKIELFQAKNQKRDMMKEIIKECQVNSFKAFKQFALNLLNISWTGTQSYLIKQIQKIQIQNCPSLKYFFINLPSLIFQAIEQDLGYKWNYKNLQNYAKQSQQYYNIYNRHFVHKPKYRLDRLIMSQGKLMSDKGRQYGQSQFQHKQRDFYIKIYMQQKQAQLKNNPKQSAILNQSKRSTKISPKTIEFLDKILRIGASNFDFQKENLNKSIKQNKFLDRKRYQQQLKTYTNGIIRLTKENLQDYQKEELKQFDKNYQNVVRWTMIEEILEYFECLDNIIGQQREDNK